MDIDASNLIIGIARPPLSKTDGYEPVMLPPTSTQTPVVSFRSADEESRKDSKLFRGVDRSAERFQSEWYPIPAPFCDPRASMEVSGDPTRITGRFPAKK